VPGIPFFKAGQRDYIHDPATSRAKAATFLKRYQQTTDDDDPPWDLQGLIQQGQSLMDRGRQIAESPARPKMKR
jgi:hypothetical protein